jgi:hypothetical protein
MKEREEVYQIVLDVLPGLVDEDEESDSLEQD